MDCIESKNFYFEIRNWLINQAQLILPPLSVSTAILGVDNTTLNADIINFILLVYKLLLFKRRDKYAPPSLQLFILYLKHYEKIEKRVSKRRNKEGIHLRKWAKLAGLFGNGLNNC